MSELNHIPYDYNIVNKITGFECTAEITEDHFNYLKEMTKTLNKKIIMREEEFILQGLDFTALIRLKELVEEELKTRSNIIGK